MNLRQTNSLLEELIAWLNGAENKLFNDNAEPIPDDAEIIVALIQDHQVRISNQLYCSTPSQELHACDCFS